MPSEKRARQRENRQRLLAERARAARMARIRRWAVRAVVAAAIVAVFVFVSALLDDGTDVSATSTATSVVTGPDDLAGFRAQATACEGATPAAPVELSFEEPEDQGLAGTVTASMVTSCGTFELALDADASPQTVNSFVFLARQGYFDGTVCHRLLPGFVLQCGDPTATGIGDPGYTVPDEFPEEGFTYEQGVVAMANAGAGTTGSQFFLVIGEGGATLPPTFSVLGRFTDPDGVIERLEAIPLGGRGIERSSPLETIYLESVTIEE